MMMLTVGNCAYFYTGWYTHRVREILEFVIKGYLLPFPMLYLIIYKRQINSE